MHNEVWGCAEILPKLELWIDTSHAQKNKVELWRESVCNTTRLASDYKTFDKRCIISVHLVYPILTIFFNFNRT